MSQKEKRICKCCGKEYEYCPHCGKHRDELWRNITDTEECREVLNIVSAYNIGRANKEQVKKVLDDYKVSDYGKYKESISAVLKKLFEETHEEPHKETKIEKVLEPVVVKEPVQPQVVRTYNDLLEEMKKIDDNSSASEESATAEKAEEAVEEAPKPERKRKNRRKKYQHMDVDSN